MDFQHYFLWSSTALIVFYLFYLLLLKRETFFVLNRIYLLAALLLSVVVPFFELSSFFKIPKIELITSSLSIQNMSQFTATEGVDFEWLPFVYWIGVLTSSLFLLFKLIGVKRSMQWSNVGEAFSFWRTKKIDENLPEFALVDKHESVHVKQLHTFDILLVEVLSIFFWFNPFVYRYKQSLKVIHEYLADEYAVNFTGSKKQYAMILFMQNFKTGPVLSNSFYHASILEARIKMLQRKKSSRYNLWKYALCIPLLAIIMLFSSFKSTDFKTTPIDQPATYPGGFEQFSKYILTTTRKVATKNGKVKVSFVVEPNGEVTNERIEIGLDEAANKEALRVIKSSPKWNPALQNGQKVRSAYDININFNTVNQ